MNAAGERRLVASDRLGDHRAQIPLAQHDQLMLVQPATCKMQQSLPIGGARELIGKDPHECATSWFAEPVNPSVSQASPWCSNSVRRRRYIARSEARSGAAANCSPRCRQSIAGTIRRASKSRPLMRRKPICSASPSHDDGGIDAALPQLLTTAAESKDRLDFAWVAQV
jgi:hypothetical protein